MSASSATMSKLQEYRVERLSSGESSHWFNEEGIVPQAIVDALQIARDEPDSMEPLLFILVTELRRETQ